jgi:adenylyl-sulfate kinase
MCYCVKCCVAHEARMKHQGFAVWLTGLSGAGKSTLAERIVARLREQGASVELLDGDFVRTNLSQGLGFSREDRDTNIHRIGFVAELLTRHGVIVVVAAISPYRIAREQVKLKIANFIEVHVDCSIEVLTARDTKGLYKRALAGELANFTGISDPYEPPLNPSVVIHSDRESVDEGLAKIWRELELRKLVK